MMNKFEELSQKELLAIVTDPRKPMNWSDSAWFILPTVVALVWLNQATGHKYDAYYWLLVLAWWTIGERWRRDQKFSALVELLRKAKVIKEDRQAVKAP